MNAPADDEARRAYWTEQMELGHALEEKILAFDQVQECGEGFASIPDAANAAGVEMEFSDSKIAGDLDRVFFMRQRLVDDVIAIGQEMNERGLILKIEDAYRSMEMQSQLGRKPEIFDFILQKCIWEKGGELPDAEFVFRRASVLVANIPKYGTHMSGSAIDISVFRQRDGSEWWRGFPYLEMSEHTPMRSPFIDETALRNRLEITEIVEAHGFVHFPFEFWHYNKDDASGMVETGRSDTAIYGPVHWDPETNTVRPYENPLAPLNPVEVIEREIAAALERAETS